MKKLCDIILSYIVLFVFFISVLQLAPPTSAVQLIHSGKYTYTIAQWNAMADANAKSFFYLADHASSSVTSAHYRNIGNSFLALKKVATTTVKKHYGPRMFAPAVNKPPSAPEILGDSFVYAGEYLSITATSTDPEKQKISYLFEWTASKSGDTHIKTSGVTPSGDPYTDRFKYAAKDIGYTYTVEITAFDGNDYSDTSYFSFIVLPHIEDFTAISEISKTPAPDPRSFYNPSRNLSGSVTFNENPQGSPFELYGAVGDNYIYVWIGLAALFAGLGIYAYFTYTGRSLISTNMKRSLYRALSRSGIKGTERVYDYELTYKMPEPKRTTSYRRTPVKRRVKW
jgi:hypothetical protein